MYLKVQVSYDKDDPSARMGAHEQWRANIFESSLLTELQMPAQFDYAAKHVRPEDLDRFCENFFKY
jgi:hypothetical protein